MTKLSLNLASISNIQDDHPILNTRNTFNGPGPRLSGHFGTLRNRRLQFTKLGRSFKTTNCIENVNRQLESYTGRVSYWQNSDQRQRWVATALLEIEPGLNRVMGHEHLKELREAMKRFAEERK